jgi:4-hydroxy-tetrahydrodipicolinate synthase
LHLGLFCEANPIPVKWALQRMGRIPGGIRLPMTPLAETNHPAMVRILSQSGVLA